MRPQELTLQIALGAALTVTKGFAAPGSGERLHPSARAVPADRGDLAALPSALGSRDFYIQQGSYRRRASWRSSSCLWPNVPKTPALFVEAHDTLGRDFILSGGVSLGSRPL